jgi:hydrogenase expression/formation protein HypE
MKDKVSAGGMIETMKESDDLILLAHGDGGLLTRELLERCFLPPFANPILSGLTDAARLGERMAVTTDSFVVDPIFFPGGDIGKLGVCGTVNDLAVSGAKPLYLTASFIIEEGLPFSSLNTITASMAETCRQAGVIIIAGDTKVVGRGEADKIFITTTGIGEMLAGVNPSYEAISDGDAVIINGPVGNHGVCILLARQSFAFNAQILSDCCPLNGVTEALFSRFSGIRFMRDLTRGGLATNAKEIALASHMDIWIDEDSIPVDDDVRGVTDILGLDPLYLANEGKFLAVVSREEAHEVVDHLKNSLGSTSARVIGNITHGNGNLYLRTGMGGTRCLNLLAGAPLPRIC